jgi:hypothetical protein
MQKLMIIGMLVAAALPSMAARRVTVAELQQMLIDRHTAGKSDAETAVQVNSLELTEQLTNLTLERIVAQVNPGTMTAQALQLLADQSALLPPPTAELSATPKPDVATQSKIIHAALAYVSGPLHGLPDLQVSQSIYSFNNGPVNAAQSGFALPSGLHLIGTWHRTMNYHNGRTALEKASATRQKELGALEGLQSWGEFGPLLAIVLGDGARGSVVWSRWQQGSLGELAVFHFSVPKSDSHYQIDYCCETKAADAYAPTGVYTLPGSGPEYRVTPAYHGDLYVDPATGAIVRLTMAADLGNSDSLSRAIFVVQYGSVELEGKNCMLPVRSVAISADHNAPQGILAAGVLITRINESKFSDYRTAGSN